MGYCTTAVAQDLACEKIESVGCACASWEQTVFGSSCVRQIEAVNAAETAEDD
jgi:hypothetical protein